MGPLTLALLACAPGTVTDTRLPPADSPALPSCVGCPELCGNHSDDDEDGAIDCDDLDCAVPDCPELCENNRDDDGDRVVDCDDLDCDGACPERCSDARDNDGDGATDCDDAACDGLCDEACADGRDNDADGFIDCDDTDCTFSCAELCEDGADNDADGLTDCFDPECAPVCDQDADGHTSSDFGGDDCDDQAPEVHPGAPEQCGNGDDDCNGLADDDDPAVDPATQQEWFLDLDFDGFGGKNADSIACAPPAEMVGDNSDCADHHPDTFPGGNEVCGDPGWDEDCDHLIDEEDPSLDPGTLTVWYDDADNDGFGDPALATIACFAPVGTVANGSDCFDDDASAGFPLLWFADEDGDGFGGDVLVSTGCAGPDGSTWTQGDCVDVDPQIEPGAFEICDEVDQDCDALVDWDDPDHACDVDANSPVAGVVAVDPNDPPYGYGLSLDFDGAWLTVGGGDGRAWLWTSAVDPPALVFSVDDETPGFGRAVALSDTWWVVGAPDDSAVFVYDLATGQLDTVLRPEGTGWGTTVAASGNLIASGAPATNENAGAVRVWQSEGGVWAELFAADGVNPGDALGTQLALDGTTLAASAPGANEVVVWRSLPDAYEQQLGCVGVAGLALDGDRLAAGRPDAQAVDFWAYEADLWSPMDTLTPLSPTTGFGAALALHGLHLVVGAPSDFGSVSVFVLDDLWREAAHLAPLGGLVQDTIQVGGPLEPSDEPDRVCAPFGAGDGWGTFQGFVYENVPEFKLNPGDLIAFDLSVENDADIITHIELSEAVVEGEDEPVAFTEIVRAGRPASPRGNNVVGDYDLQFQVESPFDFTGGGLLVKMEASGAFRSDLTCTDVLSVLPSSDPSGQLVSHFYYEYDGSWPWTKTNTSEVAPFRLQLTGRGSFGSTVAVSDGIVVVGAPSEPPAEPDVEGDVVAEVPLGTVLMYTPTGTPSPW